LWEVLWTDYYTNGMVLFVALAVLESHRDVILRYLPRSRMMTMHQLLPPCIAVSEIRHMPTVQDGGGLHHILPSRKLHSRRPSLLGWMKT